MRRQVGMAAALVAALAALPATASAAKFQYGVTSSEATQSSIVLWTRAPATGKVVAEVSPDRRFRKVTHKSQAASKSHDNTVRIKVGRLKPSSTYFYRFRQGTSVSPTGSFITAPKASSTKAFSFSYSGDEDAQRATGQSKPFYNNFEVFRSMAKERNAFNVNFGDTIYSDTEVGSTLSNGQFQPAAPIALTVAAKWAKYKQNLALKNLQLVRGETSMFNHWDDHEFINDFTPAQNGSTIYKAGVRAFTDYMPTTYKSSTGIYRSVRWGKNAELFFLDERSFRSEKASANHVCDNPDTNAPDLAPTAPQSTRNAFAILAPSLTRPVSQACLDKIRDPNRTMLGKAQLTRFTNAVKASKAKWKIVMNEVPIQQFYTLPYDRWEGYEAERKVVLTALSSLKNVVVLATDAHGNMYNDARFQTLESGGPLNSGVTEMITGPVATMTFNKEIDGVTGKPNSGAVLGTAFFKPQPPQGVGMKCYANDVFGYTQVQVSSSKLVLRPKDLNGKALQNPDNTACGPFTLTAK
jgi:alkaline phosphatase D